MGLMASSRKRLLTVARIGRCNIWDRFEVRSLFPVFAVVPSIPFNPSREFHASATIVFDSSSLVWFVSNTRLFRDHQLTQLCFLHLNTVTTNTINIFRSPSLIVSGLHSIICASLSHQLTNMGLPTFSATTNFKMVSPGEHTNNAPTLADDNMVSRATSTNSSNTDQRPPPTFGGLPTELKKLIVHHAEDSCLASLRLTNKELNAITTKPFGERLLVERRFMLSEYSLQGLVDLTAHPVFGKCFETICRVIRTRSDCCQGPCVRKVLLNTHSFGPSIKNWRNTKGKKMPKAKRGALWRRIVSIDKDFSDKAIIDKKLNLMKHALSNLNEHGNRVTLGVHDDVIHVAGRRLLRKAFGFDKLWGEISPLTDLTSEQWLPVSEIPFMALRAAMSMSGFPDSPLELDLTFALRTPNGKLDRLLGAAVMTSDHALKHDVNVCVKAGLDWTFRLFSPDDAHDRLIYEYQGTTIKTCSEDEVDLDFVPEVIGSKNSEPRYDYGYGTCSLYSPCVLGRLNHAIDSGNVTEFRVSSCATEADHLIFGICHTGDATLQQLVLADLHLFGHGCRRFLDEKNSAWPYLEGLRTMLIHHCPNLRSMVMDRVYYHVEDTAVSMALVEERHEWDGVDGVLSGLTSLISEMTVLDEEQRERWLNGEIDADGNNIVEAQ